MDFVIADLHLLHTSIISFERTQFNTIEEHDDLIIRRWNDTVSPSDTVYVLGDVGFGKKSDPSPLRDLIKQLKGHKILVVGNHDQYSDEVYIKMGFEKIYRTPIYYSPKIILSHEPVREAYENPYCINVHGHIHNGKLTLPNFFNVNAANLNYRPEPMARYVSFANLRMKKRQERFGKEWYYDFYDLTKKNT